MKKLLLIVAVATIFVSCNNDTQKGKFTVTGEIKNAPDQNIYLEELYFSQKDPEVLDTAAIKNGKFTLATLAPEAGLYRLRLEKSDAAFIFINDQPAITFSTDFNNLSFNTAVFNTPANYSLRKFMGDIDLQRKTLEEKSAQIQQYSNPIESDSMYNVLKKDFTAKENGYKQFILSYLDTTSNG